MSDVPEQSFRVLLAIATADESMFARLRNLVGERDFSEDWPAQYTYVQTLYECWDNDRKLPTFGELKSALRTSLEDEDAPDEDYEECQSIYELAEQYYKEIDAGVMRRAHKTLDQMAAELIRAEMLDKLEDGDVSSIISSAAEQMLVVNTSKEDQFASPFGVKLEQRKAGRFILTGSRLIDTYLGGTGAATGDVVGHAATRGAGKSSLVGQLADMLAAQERIRSKREARQPRVVYILNYEKVEDPLTHTLTHRSKIPRNTIETFIYEGNTDAFSKGREYKKYELKKFATQIRAAKRGKSKWPRAELERFNSARKALAKNLMVADMTGANPAFADMATEFVDGIEQFIRLHQQTVGNPGVEAVFIDYAAACARVRMRKIATTDDTERRLIEDLPFRMKHQIANPFGCFAWVSHQLAAAEASKAGGSRPDPNKFKGCYSFAENCDFCIVNGVLTLDNLAVFVHSKSRRGARQPDQIARLVGEECRWEMVTNGYSLQRNKIVSDAIVKGYQSNFDIDRES